MEVYLRKRMECIRWVARFFEFNFSDQKINSIRLKNLESLREFVRDVLHIPSLVEKEEGAEGTKRWSSQTRGSAILL